jgi:signal transduction histidine kinase/CheY-like chemotaxis protein
MSFEIYSDPNELLWAVALSAGGAGAVLAGGLCVLQRAYGREFLLHWAISFGAAALATVSSAVALQLEPGAPLWLGVSVLAQSMRFAQVVFLLSGTCLLQSTRPASRGTRAKLLALCFALGAANVLAVRTIDPREPSGWWSFSNHFFAGLAWLGAAVGLGRSARRDGTPGRWLVTFLFGLAAANGLFLAGLKFAHAGGAWADVQGLTLLPHVLNPFLQLLLLSGLLYHFFEDERASAARAALALQASEDGRRRAEHMEAVGRLAGGLAHDFNNLLTAITGHTEILLARLPPGHPDRDELAPIQHSTRRAAELVLDLLAFSRRQPHRPRHFSLDALLTRMSRTLARVLGEDVRLELELGSVDAVLFADPASIELAVINLATNARDALGAGGTFRLRTRIQRVEADAVLVAGSYLVLEACDSGCGIPPEHLDKVFEPFFTTKPGKGTGLGLASVYGIVKQSQGDVRVESQPGVGTTFRIWLPRAESGTAVDSSVLAVRELVPNAPGLGGNETILLAEDDDSVRHLTQRQLNRAGYRVLTAEDAGQALACLASEHQPIHLVLSDVIMPGRPLNDLLEVLHGRPEIRVLLMSGYSETSILLRGVDPGEALLVKPFTTQTLLKRVRATLDAPNPARVPA